MGSAGDEVYQSLLRAERVLFNATGDDEQRQRLKTRWWIQVDFTVAPNGPQYLSEVWRAAAEASDPRVRYLSSEGLPETIIPGIYFRAEWRTLVPETVEVIRNWCQGLISCFAPTKQLAIVLDLAGPSTEKAKKMVAYVRDSLSEGGCATAMPVEVMSLANWHDPGGESVQSESLWASILADDANEPPGIYLYSWINDAVAAARLSGSDLVQQKEYRSVISAARPLARKFGDSYRTSITSKQVVEDLDQLAATELELYTQFLRLVQEHLPGRLIELIKSYAQSPREESRRAGLIFATQSGFFMDTWLEGLSRRWEYMPDVLALCAEPGEGPPPANQLVLALLRRYNRGQDREQINNTLAKLRGELSSDINAVILLTLGQTREAYLSSNHGERLLLAVMAGAGTKILPDIAGLPERLKELDVPEVWWALAALPPSAQRLTDILALDSARRAVFGLCSPEEWSALRRDDELERLIIACRLDRPLCFTPQP